MEPVPKLLRDEEVRAPLPRQNELGTAWNYGTVGGTLRGREPAFAQLSRSTGPRSLQLPKRRW